MKTEGVTSFAPQQERSYRYKIELKNNLLTLWIEDQASKQQCLTLTIQFLRSTWVAKYELDLEPVLVERIDVVESKLRDHQDELKRICGELSIVQAPPFISLQATRTTQYSRLCWNKAECTEFAVNGNDGEITIKREGVYKIGGVINSIPRNYDQAIRLLSNGTCIRLNYCAYLGSNHYVSTPMDAIVLLQEGDKLMVTCDSKSISTSYLSIVSIVN
ncbi:unnamed protein product [Phytophthora fragariaefolia]|uniref:Unnamed protein product n=1 Tax=Phytophthora fragariaefolia TaxID=1490495 RepID=A0A9W6YK08_9STRA|nr:unnamed protein product [Phytophthora fragariaefolia]